MDATDPLRSASQRSISSWKRLGPTPWMDVKNNCRIFRVPPLIRSSVATMISVRSSPSVLEVGRHVACVYQLEAIDRSGIGLNHLG